MATKDSVLWILFEQLRRRRFPLGPDDYQALQQALRAGFGWSSRQALCELCCALWAKSYQEQEILVALFDQLDLPDWELPQPVISFSSPSISTPSVGGSSRREESGRGVIRRIYRFMVLQIWTYVVDKLQELRHLWRRKGDQEGELAPTTQVYKGLPPIRLDKDMELPKRPFVFVPQFPLSYREIAQAWRRLRRPIRSGPLMDLDVEATVERHCRLGIASPMVLMPRRRNTARLILLVDRQGSMAPFHRFIENVCTAIQQAGKLENAALYYFHDVPAEGADRTVLNSIADKLFPALDTVLPQITPLTTGYVYDDRELLSPIPQADVLKEHASGAAIVVISDAGAAHGRYDTLRLLDTAAFLKTLHTYTSQYVWLNPLPRDYWRNSTAAQIARHVPMFPLDREGMYSAVNVLRGQPFVVEKPV